MQRLLYDNKGQVVVLSVIAVGFVSLVISSALIGLSFNSLNVVTATFQAVAAAAVNNACAEAALYQIRLASSYTGSASVTVDGKTCNYTVTNTGGNGREITFSSAVVGVVRRGKINLTVEPIEITSWQEIP